VLDIEADFWRIVEENYQRVEVQYGADLYTSETGSGFPTNDGTEYALSPWNLNNIPHCDGQFPSLLRHVSCPMDKCPYPICPHVNIPGAILDRLTPGLRPPLGRSPWQQDPPPPSEARGVSMRRPQA
jgi:hypothetical protein